MWVKAHKLTREVYHVTTSFPKNELHGLTSQIRRAAASIPTNIAYKGSRNAESNRLWQPYKRCHRNQTNACDIYKAELSGA